LRTTAPEPDMLIPPPQTEGAPIDFREEAGGSKFTANRYQRAVYLHPSFWENPDYAGAPQLSQVGLLIAIFAYFRLDTEFGPEDYESCVGLNQSPHEAIRNAYNWGWAGDAY